MKLYNFSLKRIALVSSMGLFSALNAPLVQAQTIDNAGFENSLNDWVQTEPASSSGVERSGSGSAKLSGSGARISQTINVSTNTNYTLTAYISGSGTLGVTVGGSTSDDDVSDTDSNSTFEQAQVSFNSGSNSSVTIFGAYNGDEGRFDDFSIVSNGSSSAGSADDSGGVFNIQKRNTDFSIDGAGGAQEGIQIYLWNTSATNVNQQWEETDVGNGFVSYRKVDTNLCIDGGNGGSTGQAVILFTCNSSNMNQHWQKVSTAENSFRLKKRSVSFSIDGQNGASRRQVLELAASQDSNVNQQWVFNEVGSFDGGGDLGGVGDTFNMRKQNTAFSIDGNGGAQEGTQIYLWNTSFSNVNQQWEEIDVGSGFVAYRKKNTNLCIDGGNGGERGQAVIIFTCDIGNQNQHWSKVSIAGGSTRLQKRNASGFSIDGQGGAERNQVLHLWTNSDTNVNQQWVLADINSDEPIIDDPVSDAPVSDDPVSDGEFGLNPNADPWDNFDLTDWALDTPAPRDGSSNSSERTTDVQFAAITAGTEDIRDRQKPFFFTADDGGMTFRSTIGGGTTSSGSNGFTRSELREMLRRGNDDIEDTGTTPNNWQLGYAQTNSDFGGQPKGGELTATLRVNRVTTTGSTSGQPGRVIVGQIHAGSNEPIRLYYRKLPQNTNGSIYFAHETADSDETYFEIIGSRSSSQSNPSNGVALGELWSYEINQSGSEIEVVIRRGDRNGSIIERETIDMNDLDSGYDDRDEWMYFKAGAYTQNDSGDDDDYDEVTFYRLSNTH